MADYSKTDFEVLTNDIHRIDQIELHKQTGDMIYSSLTNKESQHINCKTH